MGKKKKQTRPSQQQKRQPGREGKMDPHPEELRPEQQGSGKLRDKAALISGGDSGIGRAVAVAFAREGADVAIVYYEEDEDAKETQRLVEQEGRQCVIIKGDVGRTTVCEKAVNRTLKAFDHLDVLVNNAAMQFPTKSLEDISDDQLERTFKSNIFSTIRLSRAALPHLKKRKGSSIINTTSVTAYRGSPGLMDYSATKGAIVSFTRSLSTNLAKEGVRVNAVAPGPIWTPLIPSTFPEEKVETFGSKTPMGRPGEPEECAGCYVFLASDDASYMTGQVLHPNGGEVVGA